MDAPFRPPLRGREQELAAIRRKLSQVRAGTGCVVVVEGSAGLGKTRLLDERIDSSHVPMLSHPDYVLDVIRAAAAGV